MNKNNVFIIAEAGVNHNGSPDLAIRLVEEAAKSGADAVKFQTSRTEKLISRCAPKAEYQKQTTDAEESQFEMCRKLEFAQADHERVMEACRQNKIKFLSAPFDLDSLEFLVHTCRVDTLKIPSGEITNPLLLLRAGQSGTKIILSTGMSFLGEVESALAILAFGMLHDTEPNSLQDCYNCFTSEAARRKLQERVTLLHCTTEYPAPFADVNLKCMDTLRQTFNLPVGYSDHTIGIAVPLAAVGRGAVIIEKHFTLDRRMKGPDHRASLEPPELTAMVKAIRQIEPALGNGQKYPSPSEQKNMAIARKSLIANRHINRGEQFNADNLTVKRPGDGITALRYWEYLGQTAQRDYEEDEKI